MEDKLMRGKIKERETKNKVKLQRRLLSNSYSLELNKELCNGCGICVDICPKEVIEQTSAVVKKGVLVKKPAIDIDYKSCIFCGECAALCPLKAIVMRVDGEEISVVEKNETFPSLKKGIEVSKEKVTVYDDVSSDSLSKTEHMELSKCNPECELICQSECPTEAITVSVQKSDSAKIEKIVDVQIDESKCIYCKRCELACPFEAIRVQKPFHGRLELDASACPEDCLACQDICPSGAIRRVDGKLVVSADFCVFCSACEKVCPEKVITVKRDQVFCADIDTGVWLTALKKLVPFESFRKDAMVRGNKRRFKVVDRMKDYIGCEINWE
jgi:4Fe-4S ferredoxin